VRLHTPSLKTLGVAKRVAEDGVIVLYWRDLSREAEMNAMKNAFLAKAAHELRTPLTSILGFTELLAKDANATAKQAEIVAIMARQGKNLLQLIHDLLDLARLEVQNPQWQRQSPQSLVALTRLIASDFQMAGDERQWIFALEEHLPEVRLDPNAYRQVLSNLLSNAMKYSPKGSLIRIASRVKEREGVLWQGIAIEDRGIGMSAEELERLGQRFYRANPQGDVAGTGLGLAVVEEIMGLHGGRVEYASELGVGSTVTVWFLQTRSFGKV
jgi:signal transduction histidine kinase